MASEVMQIIDHTAQIEKELEKAIEKALFIMGTECVAGCVEKASEKDSQTGRPTVDTGRYRAGFGFITPYTAKMTSRKSDASQARDNITNNRSNKGQVIIANNVEYAAFLEAGTSRGMHARNIMKRGIESKFDDMKSKVKKVLVNTDITVGDIE